MVAVDLKKKVGPLPAWAWAMILGGGIGAYLLLHKKPATSAETALPELGAQALPLEGGGGAGAGAAGSLEAAEAKNSAELEALRQQVAAGTGAPTGGLGAGIGEVIQAREALEALGLSVGSPGARTEAASASGSPVKAATGKGPGYPLSSSRGHYRDVTYKGHAAHAYAHRVAGGVGPGGNIIVLGGPAKVTHAAPGSHVPAHASKPPAHHHARPKPAKAKPRPVHHAAAVPAKPVAPAPHGAAVHHGATPVHEPPRPRRRRRR